MLLRKAALCRHARMHHRFIRNSYFPRLARTAGNMALAAEIHTAEYVRGLFMYRIDSLAGRMTLLATAAFALFLTAVEAQPPLPTTTPAPTAAPVPTATPKPPLGSAPAGPAAAPQSSPVPTAPAGNARNSIGFTEGHVSQKR